MPRESWASRFGFIMATAGYSIGLGNIWRFPYLTGSNGGGAFLLVYLLLAVLIGVPLFTAEISLGRRAQLTPIAGMRRLTGTGRSPWTLIGWLGVVAAFLVGSYYIVVMGWVMAYVVATARGRFTGISPDQAQRSFTAFVADPLPVLGYTAAVVILTGVVVIRGLRHGIEAACRWLMPGLFVALLLLAVGSLAQPGAMAGVRWYLAPSWSALTPGVTLAALGQVFYSVGIGMAAGFVYGSYLHPTESDVPGGALLVVGFDTLAAVVAGFVIFPALFAFGLAPDVGPGLLFVTMTALFAKAPAGAVVGAAFFLLVTIAGLTSLIAVTEALTASLIDSLGLRRRVALWSLLGTMFLAGIPSALSFGPWADVRILGRDVFSLLEHLAGGVLLATSGLVLAIYTAWVWGFAAFQRETNTGARRFRVSVGWRLLVRYLIPAGVTLVLLSSLGVFQ